MTPVISSPKAQMDFGNKKKRRPGSGAGSATDLFGRIVPTPAAQQGRRLVLKFMGQVEPALDRIEFHASNASPKFEYLQRKNDSDPTRAFRFGEAAKILAMLLLDHLCEELMQQPRRVQLEGGNGSQAATLGNAIYDSDGKFHSLLTEYQADGSRLDRVNQVFDGTNWHGGSPGQRIIYVRADYLPADCFEVYWDAQLLAGSDQIKRLTDQFRRAWKFSPPITLDLPKPEDESVTAPSELSSKVTVERPEHEPEKPGRKFVERSKNPFHTGKAPASSRSSPLSNQGSSAGQSQPKPTGQPESIPPTETPQTKSPASATPPPQAPSDVSSHSFKIEFKPSLQKELPDPPQLEIPTVSPQLYEITNPHNAVWYDHAGLIDFGNDETEDDLWRIRDASEGVLIFGMPASGKTSASGFLFARNFLTAGYGGLVMAAKTDEAKRWVTLCERFGRSNDCIVINSDGPHKLNFLAYETQRPRKSVGPTKDLCGFFRNLIKIVSRQGNGREPEAFWVHSVDELMENLFETFLLADEPMTIDRLKRFVVKSPKSSAADWRNIPYFGEIMRRAQQRAETPADRDAFRTCLEFWTESFADLTDITRGGVVAGFTSMASVLTGRGISEMISRETTVTPESILSGKIVILDVAVKGDGGLGGLMIQGAWKYLFQRAIERRSDKGKKTARPVFLWEDKGHLFFSPNDADFQPTARDCRSAHVIITQNLNNFFQLGHKPESVKAVFGSMNTHIFHCNGDHETNKWASDRIGTAVQTLSNFSTSSNQRKQGEQDQDDWNQTSSGSSVNEQFVPAFRPESFELLKKGGNGFCEALILWCSHQFKANRGKPYCVKMLEQDSENIPHT